VRTTRKFEQVITAGATPIQKAEGVWTGFDGSIWFVSCRGDGPDAEDEEDVSAAVHSGQIGRYYPRGNRIELVTLFPNGNPSMDRKPYHRSGSGRHSMISTDSPGNIAKCG
jgi:hypothetical protein